MLYVHTLETEDVGDSAHDFMTSPRPGDFDCLILVGHHARRRRAGSAKPFLDRMGIPVPTMIVAAYNEVSLAQEGALLPALVHLYVEPMRWRGACRCDQLRQFNQWRGGGCGSEGAL